MFKWIVFDCMETLIDMDPLPRGGDYALWAFEDSCMDKAGVPFRVFHDGFEEAKVVHVNNHGAMAEWSMSDRILFATGYALSRWTDAGANVMDPQLCAKEAFDLFWNRYLSACYMSPSNLNVVREIQRLGYGLAVASNFTVPGGVEAILSKTGALMMMDHVHASIEVGIRKPDKRFYDILIEKLNASPSEILFIGDDYECDYIGPQAVGIASCLYDPSGGRYVSDEREANGLVSRIERLEEILLYL